MLPFKNRLIKKSDFEKVWRNGSFYSHGNIAVKACKNGLSETRIGIIAGIKFSKRATERNQAKRYIRDIFHRILPEMIGGVDIVVMIRRKDQAMVRRETLEKSIACVLEKSRVIRTREIMRNTPSK